MWELWYDILISTPNGLPNPQLSGNLAAALGNCARILCSNNFNVSPCLDNYHKKISDSHSNHNIEVDIFDKLFDNSAIVSVPGKSFLLSRKKIFDDMVMVITSRNDHENIGEKEEDKKCWVYPGEHMSFSLLHSLESERIMNNNNGYKNQHINEEELDDSHIIYYNHSVGSLLHLLGIENWFHILREGLGGIIYLNRTLPENTPILLPDSPSYKRVGKHYINTRFIINITYPYKYKTKI